jgi:thymidylate kinase
MQSESPITNVHGGAGHEDVRAALLFRVFAVLDRQRIPWCVLHGYQSWPANLGSDVDLVMLPRMLPRELAKLLHENRAEIGAEVVLWLNDGAQFVVLCARQPGQQPIILQLHVSADYSMAGRTFYTADDIINSRVKRDTYWVPAPHIEFGCVLVNRVIKKSFRPEHEQRLAEIAAQHPADCEREARRFFNAADVRPIMQAARLNDWSWVKRHAGELHRNVLSGPGARRSSGRIGGLARKVSRWLKPPCGLHVVFLGPDGVGKSTVIERVQRDLSPIFLQQKYLTFAPGLLPTRFEVPKPDGPHSLPPRGFVASLMKAAWWTVCYTVGYLVSIHAVLARAGLVVNHRYLPDAIVDPKRYRYSGPQWILRALWRVAPKPHLLFLLDAPAEVIQARKKEVAPEETKRQRDGYRAMAEPLPFAHIIDNNRPLEQVVDEIDLTIIEFLTTRAAHQLRLEGR